MNALLFDLCKAPYIVLMEEDWLYMDAAVAEPTLQRRHAIAHALALLETPDLKDPTTDRPRLRLPPRADRGWHEGDLVLRLV